MLNRGFTAHEMLDVHGLVHMNGRVYDPELGRFLSADPLVQFPHSTQGLDRYSYVHNNPLSYTDPSGHLVFFLVAAVYAATHASLQFLAINIMLAAVAGYLETGTLRGALFSALSAGFAGGVGALMQELGSFAGAWFVQAALHGLVQGTLAAAQGGRWRAGFAAGFFGSAAGGFNPGRFGGAGTAAMVLRVLKAAVVGGTAARLGGGKFANGAVTGAFVQAFAPRGGGKSADDDIDWDKVDADSRIDPAAGTMGGRPLMAANSLPQGVVDFAAGLGDGIFFGFGDEMRAMAGIDGGVNETSGAYRAGGYTAVAGMGGARLTYAAAAKG